MDLNKLFFLEADTGANTTGGSNDNGDQSGADSSKTDNMIPYDRFQSVVKDKNEFKTKYEQLLQQQKEAEEAAQKQKGEFESLYNDLKTKYDPLEQQFKLYQQTFQETLKSKLDSVPEKFKKLMPKGSELEQLNWLQEAEKEGLFTTNTVQSFGNDGANPDTSQKENAQSSFFKQLQRKF